MAAAIDGANRRSRQQLRVHPEVGERHDLVVAATEVLAAHDNVPPGVAPADNELGWRMSLAKLARLVEVE